MMTDSKLRCRNRYWCRGFHRSTLLWVLLLWTFPFAAPVCHFPSKLTGLWFQKGWQSAIRIDGSTFSIKGTCIDSNQNMFLIEDSKEKCFRCIIIHEKHPNVLQYRETYCDEHRTLEEACSSLTVDNHLHTMFKVHSSPVPCPFKGPFTFNYSRGQGECRHPPSTIDTCTDDSQLLFRFQACADVIGTESSEEELTCLATWKEGSAHYLVGKMKPRKSYAVPHGDENYYRCFVYEKDKDTFDISQSADPTCDGLVSPRDGSRIMKLTKTKHPTSGCQFPSWVTSTHHWHTLDGRMSYYFSHRNTSYRIVHQHSGHAETKVTCTDEVSSTPNSTTVVAYSMQGCSNGFVCLTFHQREKHIIEIQTGEFARRPHDACSSPRYDSGGMDYITLVAHSASVIALCPQLAETNGLRIASNKNHIRSDQCQDSAVKVVGCRSHDSLEFLSTCETVREHMTFQCQGTWEENGRNYLIAGLKGSKVRYCFVYYSNPKMTQFSGLPDTCRRTIVPGVTGNLTFNITSAGECDNLLNSSSRLKHTLDLLLTAAVLILSILLVR
ncbi:uncharacterized protein LOC129960940 isoform X1 [Argiope bruennichi]|uniref:uncharacterized protein LOC129960940 isoform X1 n=1 Tax=Argiope bruennichi TaxID=94029 RepID=UPI0024949538|nr:uncharacterized protein LOC129960940 isoform X1 [Argiope bruennichi]